MSVLPEHCPPELHAITVDVEYDSWISQLTRVGLPGPRRLVRRFYEKNINAQL